MGDVDGGDAELLLDAPELELHVFAQLAIEGGERFIEEEEIGLEHEGAGDRDPLLLAAGELLDAARAEACQAGRDLGNARRAG